MSARIALCPGSFDPLTLGHEDIVRRALSFADRVIVAVSHSPTTAKKGMFGVEERVEAAAFQGLLVDFARERGAGLVVRGVRGVVDWEYESQMAVMNRRLLPTLETVVLPADPMHAHVSATLIRQIATLGGDVSPFVSAAVLRRVKPAVGS
jgi:pantetheine-phosphate adenylyltransferase